MTPQHRPHGDAIHLLRCSANEAREMADRIERVASEVEALWGPAGRERLETGATFTAAQWAAEKRALADNLTETADMLVTYGTAVVA